MENTEQLTPDAVRAIKRADILINKIERGERFSMVSLKGQGYEYKVKESWDRMNGVIEMVELTNTEFIRLLKGEK